MLSSFFNTILDPFFVQTTVGAGTPLAEQRSSTLEPLSTDWSAVTDWISGSTIKNETENRKVTNKRKGKSSQIMQHLLHTLKRVGFTVD